MPLLTIQNILTSLPTAIPDECFETIIDSSAVRIERIVSCGQVTPAGQWYDQERDEWVLLLAGAAELLFEDDITSRHLSPGDCLLIPAGRRHRVAWTDPAVKTVWLAVHFDDGRKP
jgi:cupin 2 domain-containing protein